MSSTITTLPTPPSRTEPSVFSTRADAFLGALPTFVTEANALSTEVNGLAVQVNQQSLQVADAQAIVGVTKWIDGNVYTEGNLVWSPADGQTYRCTRNGAPTHTDPSALPAYFAMIVSVKRSGNYDTTLTVTGTTNVTLPTSGIVQAGWSESQRSSNTILGVADHAVIINITSGTFSQTFTAAATLGAKWTCVVKNSGSGIVTLDPNGSETIDGLTSYPMYPGEVRLIQCSGSAFSSVVLKGFSYVATATGATTFTKPPGYTRFGGLIWGGGGSGGYQSGGGVPGGGGGGGCTPFDFAAADMGASATITIGAGGASKGTIGAGNSGGNSTIALTSKTITAYGGGGGGYNTAPGQGGGGGGGGILGAGNQNASNSTVGVVGGDPYLPLATTGSLASPGWGGGNGQGSDSSKLSGSVYGGGGGGYNGGVGGNSVYGGAGGSNGTTSATSIFGGNGGNTNSVDGIQPGGGGAGKASAASGKGGDGQCIIWGIV